MCKHECNALDRSRVTKAQIMQYIGRAQSEKMLFGIFSTKHASIDGLVSFPTTSLTHAKRVERCKAPYSMSKSKTHLRGAHVDHILLARCSGVVCRARLFMQACVGENGAEKCIWAMGGDSHARCRANRAFCVCFPWSPALQK